MSGDFKISNVVYDTINVSGREEICWRIVRPNVENVIGLLHADRWFHKLGQSALAPAKPDFTIKIRIPLSCELGKSEPMVVPESHKREWRHGSVSVNGINKPTFDDVAIPILIETPPGKMLIFREETLHKGCEYWEVIRVSAEITMVLSHRFDSYST